MKDRKVIYDDQENFIIWNEWEDGVEIIVIYGDKALYYQPGQLLDMVLFTQILEKLNLGEYDRNNIRNIIFDLYDSWKGVNK